MEKPQRSPRLDPVAFFGHDLTKSYADHRPHCSRRKLLSFTKHEHHKHVDSNVSHNTIRPSAMFGCGSFATANIEGLVHILDMVLLIGNQSLQVLQFWFMMDPQLIFLEFDVARKSKFCTESFVGTKIRRCSTVWCFTSLLIKFVALTSIAFENIM
jgi:hypothetical protein